MLPRTLGLVHLVKRQVLVDADILRQAEHALGDDVLQDLVRAAGDAKARRPHEALLEDRIGRQLLAFVIEQARADWRAGRFELPPGDDEEWIPLPERD